jgi:hypothetical protein
MRCVHCLMAVAIAAASLACRTVRPRHDVPAVIVDPTARSRAALARAVSAALGGAPVTLADDALTQESTLLVERARLRDPAGLPANGRRPGGPERFRLVKSGPECVLVHERDGSRFALEETACAPARDGP